MKIKRNQEWKGMKKRYAEPHDDDIYGQQEWAALMGRLRKLQEESHMYCMRTLVRSS